MLNRRRLHGTTGLMILAGTVLSLATLSTQAADARTLPLLGGQAINVSVGFNTRLPLADLGEEALAEAQKQGRRFVYRLAREECAVLKATIAETCRLTNLNVSTQIQHGNNQAPVQLYINGSANFQVSLKPEPAAE